ncbi:hypothetical protein JW960_07845 [candidate division KSB1 bacterium]|nr:hypothetical protein [candidate division KSB1 bacterium]
MKKHSLVLLLLFLLSCHKDPMIKQGFKEVKLFQWTVNEGLNQLTIKFSPADVPVESIETMIIRIQVDEIELENIYRTPTVKIDNDEDSPYHGRKVVEKTWIPSLEISATTLEYVSVYIK